jgi:hypothetical protein
MLGQLRVFLLGRWTVAGALRYSVSSSEGIKVRRIGLNRATIGQMPLLPTSIADHGRAITINMIFGLADSAIIRWSSSCCFAAGYHGSSERILGSCTQRVILGSRFQIIFGSGCRVGTTPGGVGSIFFSGQAAPRTPRSDLQFSSSLRQGTSEDPIVRGVGSVIATDDSLLTSISNLRKERKKGNLKYVFKACLI